MKEITLFEATDGVRFTTKDQCLNYEANGCVEFYPLPGYGDHLPLDDSALSLLQCDGSFYYATATKMSRINVHRGVHIPHPPWATHVIYFGK